MSKLVLFGEAVIVVLTISACSVFGPPTPTPDVPRFADGEAIAVVKGWIRDKTFIPNPRISCFNVLETLPKGMTSWSESYLGTGIWSVTLKADRQLASALKGVNYEELSDRRFVALLAFISEGGEWRVYEYTGRVDSERRSYVEVACR